MSKKQFELKLEEKRLKIKDFGGFKEELNAGSDRNNVILWVARLDVLVEELLRKALISQEKEVDNLLKGEGGGPLGSFGAKIRTLYCLGILSKSEFENLRLITKIRNAFAHELHGLSFETPKISDICSKLDIAFDSSQVKDSRVDHRFTLACILLDVGLPVRLELISQPTLRPERTWEDDMVELSRTVGWETDEHE